MLCSHCCKVEQTFLPNYYHNYTETIPWFDFLFYNFFTRWQYFLYTYVLSFLFTFLVQVIKLFYVDFANLNLKLLLFWCKWFRIFLKKTKIDFLHLFALTDCAQIEMLNYEKVTIAFSSKKQEERTIPRKQPNWKDFATAIGFLFLCLRNIKDLKAHTFRKWSCWLIGWSCYWFQAIWFISTKT